MVTFVLSDDQRNRVTVRPSGTEPKLKYYIQLYAPVASGASVPSVREPLSQAALSVAEEIVNLSGHVIGGDLPSSDAGQVQAWREEWSAGGPPSRLVRLTAWPRSTSFPARAMRRRATHLRCYPAWRMRIGIVGGGPAGLYFALLMKQQGPAHTVEVVEQNPADATFGFGVVFSDRALGFLERADPESYADIQRRLQTWERPGDRPP